MAETYTMQPNNEVTTLDNLTPEEQDSLAVGEQMQEAQDNLLAGKYKSAQELEQGYLELQKKLGQDSDEEEGEYEEEGEEEEYEEGDEEYEDDGEESESILDELWAERITDDDEEFSDEIIERISEMDPQDLAIEYLQYRESVEQDSDFTPEEVTSLYAAAGGQEQYATMLDWAQNNLSKQETEMFDAVMEKGDALGAFFAIRALAFTYENAVGVDGNLVQGKAPRSGGTQFRSQAEVVAAMGDPRYDNDPAYRADIMNKLQRSPNVQF
tara:strand:- start:521 stop:1327 length:807 start_codon:yes stop_codon:yes gene_type:complete